MTHVEVGGIDRIQVTAPDRTAFVRGQRILDKAISALDLLKAEEESASVPIIKEAELSIVGEGNPMFFVVGQGANVEYEIDGINKKGQLQGRIARELDGIGITPVGRVELSSYPKSGEHKAVLSSRYDKVDPSSPEEAEFTYVHRKYTVRDLGKLSIAVVSAEDFQSSKD